MPRKTKTSAKPDWPSAEWRPTSRFGEMIAPALLLGFNVTLLGTFQMYRGNASEFVSGYGAVMPTFLVALLTVVVVSIGIGMLLPRRAYRFYLPIVFSLGVLTWVQGAFLMGEYGVFDGRGIDWSAAGWRAQIDVVIWAGVLLAVIVYFNRVRPWVRFTCATLIVLQLGVPVVQAFFSPQGAEYRRMWKAVDRSVGDVYGYSSTKNILHVILDGYQTDVFLELVEEEGLKETLNGFVVFSENTATASQTSFAVPSIFSGNTYEGEESVEDYFNHSINVLGFQNALFAQGYTVNLSSHVGMHNGKYTNYRQVPTSYGRSAKQIQKKEGALLLDLSLFRQVPHLLRRVVHSDDNWLLARRIADPPAARSFHQRAFLDDYFDLIHIEGHTPYYNFMHLMSPHPPYATLADGSYAGSTLPLTRENYKNEARAMLKGFVKWLDYLRGLGIYESSMVILQGDHGSDHDPVWNGRSVDLPIGRGPALLAIKRFDSVEPFGVSSVPSSLGDIAATVAQEAGLTGTTFPGQSVFTIPEGADRERKYLFYDSSNPASPTMQRYLIRGSVYDPAAWSNPERIAVNMRPPIYPWGTILGFGAGGNAQRYLLEGWSPPMSSNYQWTDGKRAKLRFEVDPPQENVVLEFIFAPYIAPGKVDRQNFTLYCDDVKVGTGTGNVHQSATARFIINPDPFADGMITLTFDLPDAVSPRTIGTGGDARELGIFLSRLRMYPESETEMRRQEIEAEKAAGRNGGR